MTQSPQESSASAPKPRRLWLVVLIVALAAGGAIFSAASRRSASRPEVATPAARAQLLELGMGICNQCKRMRPVMAEAGRALGDAVEVRVLDVREPPNDALARRLRMVSMPLIVLLDSEGTELWRHVGFLDVAPLLDEVRPHLADAR